MRHDLFHDGIPGKDRHAVNQHVQRTAQAIDISPVVGALGADRLLRGHEVDGSHDRAGHRQFAGCRVGCRVAPASQSHVQHLDRAFSISQQVAWFDVAMDHAFVMGVDNPLAGLQNALSGHHRVRADRQLWIRVPRSQPSTYSITRKWVSSVRPASNDVTIFA